MTQFVPTFNAHGTFHRRHHLPFRRDYHGLGNLAAHGPGCRFSPLETRVLFSQDILLINVDQFTTLTTGTGSLGAPFESKFRQTDALKSEERFPRGGWRNHKVSVE